MARANGHDIERSREIPPPARPLNTDYRELRALRSVAPGRIWISGWDPGRVRCSVCGGAWRLGWLQLDLVEHFEASVECPWCRSGQPSVADFSRTPTSHTRHGRPIMASEIISGVKECRVCHGTNLVAWGLWAPPDDVVLFDGRGETAPAGLKRCAAYGLCRACFDLRVDDGLPLQWVAR